MINNFFEKLNLKNTNVIIKLLYAIPNIIRKINNFYGVSGSRNNNFYEYFLKLDGYFFCEKKKKLMAIIRVRYKRLSEIIALDEIINNQSFLKELHPVDVFFIGILSNNEKNGIIPNGVNGWKEMARLKDYKCFAKIDPMLYILRKYFDKSGSEIIVLYSDIIKKEITISISELCNNLALICALDGFQAISIGYDVSESYIRKNLLNGKV